MPHFDSTTPRSEKELDLKGLKGLRLPEVFQEGHALTADEARFVNARLSSILVNSYGGEIRRAVENIDAEREKAHKEGTYKGPMTTKSQDGKTTLKHERPAWATVEDLKGDDWDHQANLDRKFLAYKVGAQNRQEPAPGNPLDKVARDIAVREVKEIAIKRKYKVKDLMETKDEEYGSKFQRFVHERLNGSQRDRIYALAQHQLDNIEDDGGMDFTGIPAEGEAANEDKEAA